MDKKREMDVLIMEVGFMITCMFINRLCKSFKIRISYLIKSNMQMPCMFVPFPRVGLHHFEMFVQNKFILRICSVKSYIPASCMVFYYSCGLSTTTIEYSSPSVCRPIEKSIWLSGFSRAWKQLTITLGFAPGNSQLFPGPPESLEPTRFSCFPHDQSL